MTKEETQELTPNMKKFFDRMINLKHYVNGAFHMSENDETASVLGYIIDVL